MKKRRSPHVAVAVLCLVQFVDVLGVTVVITALPAMLAGLDAAPSTAAYVVTGYAMFFGGLLMLGARLGDRYGPRQVLLAGLAGFGAASLLAAAATSAPALVAARCLQGAAAALSVPTALRLVLVAAGDAGARGHALAGWSAAGATAGASGFLLGGALTELASWRAVFWINLPLTAALVAAVLTSAPRPPGTRERRLDVAGAGVLTASVMAVVCGASLLERPEARVFGLLALVVGAALLATFAAIERRTAEPLLPVAAARHPCLRTGAGAGALNTATTSSAATLATLYLQDTRGASPTATGLLLLPFSLCVIAGSAASAPLLRARPARASIALGLGIIGIGTSLLLALPAANWLLPVAFAIAGVGIGISSVAANALGTAVPPTLQGVASGALNTAAQLGTALGVSVLVVVATSSDGAPMPLAGTPLAWACAAAAALAGAVVMRPRARRARAARAPETTR